MCNLYSMTTNQQAIIDLVKAWNDQAGNLPPMSGIYPDYTAPVVINDGQGRILTKMRWGMPSPAFALKGKNADKGITNIRNTKSPHWRRWLGPENRCLVPFNAFSEFHKGHGPKWFALNETQPVGFFAGIWTPWTSTRKVKDGETTDNLFGFLTTDANNTVAAVHPQAMPVVLTKPDEIDAWLSAPTDVALQLQRPLPDDALIGVDGPI
jgi:putative SOS response-associated peptidase YedK